MKGLVNKMISNAHVLLLLYGLYGFWIQHEEHNMRMEELQAQFPQLEQQIQQMSKKVSEIEDFLKKTDEYKARVEGVAKNIEEVQKQLPADINDSQILTYFSNEISALNIKDPNITPGREEANTYFISKEYNLKAKGTFLQFLILLERFGNASRIYNIKTLSLKVAEDKKKGRFQMVHGEGAIQAYRYNPDFRVERGFEKTGGIK